MVMELHRHFLIVVVATDDKKPSWMKRGKAKREHKTQGGKCIMLGKFYTSTPNVVNDENLIPLNSCED